MKLAEASLKIIYRFHLREPEGSDEFQEASLNVAFTGANRVKNWLITFDRWRNESLLPRRVDRRQRVMNLLRVMNRDPCHIVEEAYEELRLVSGMSARAGPGPAISHVF